MLKAQSVVLIRRTVQESAERVVGNLKRLIEAEAP